MSAHDPAWQRVIQHNLHVFKQELRALPRELEKPDGPSGRYCTQLTEILNSLVVPGSGGLRLQPDTRFARVCMPPALAATAWPESPVPATCEQRMPGDTKYQRGCCGLQGCDRGYSQGRGARKQEHQQRAALRRRTPSRRRPPSRPAVVGAAAGPCGAPSRAGCFLLPVFDRFCTGAPGQQRRPRQSSRPHGGGNLRGVAGADALPGPQAACGHGRACVDAEDAAHRAGQAGRPAAADVGRAARPDVCPGAHPQLPEAHRRLAAAPPRRAARYCCNCPLCALSWWAHSLLQHPLPSLCQAPLHRHSRVEPPV